MHVTESARNKRAGINSQKLDVLLNVTNAINSNQSTEHLLETFRDFIKHNLNIQKLALYSNEKGWQCLLQYGLKVDAEKIDIEAHLLEVRDILPLSNFNCPALKSFDFVVPVFHKSQPLAYLFLGDISVDQRALSPTIKHLPFIQTLTNIIVVAIENKRLAKEKLMQEGMKKELELASQMQAWLFPDKLPNDEKIEAAAFYMPHQQVGGDYYDFVRLNENEVIICMADVSGKGMSAALMMSNFQANLRALAKQCNTLTDLAKVLNQKVLESAKGEKHVTIFIARYNQQSRIMHFLNAGQNPPILISGETTVLLQTGSPGLGMFDELPKVKEGIISVDPKSVLLCYTDGVVELENELGNEFGIDQLKELFLHLKELPMQEINNGIIENLKSYKGIKSYFDDIALLSFRFH
jgi:phosphoserine phosphatase RsbU/P